MVTSTRARAVDRGLRLVKRGGQAGDPVGLRVKSSNIWFFGLS